MTVLLEWVGQERRVVGWESRWTEECVGWAGEVVHCVGRTGGWMGDWWVSEQYWELSRWSWGVELGRGLGGGAGQWGLGMQVGRTG